MSDAFRLHLKRLLEDRGISYAQCSQAMGRNHAYMQQYLERGTPRFLKESDREVLEEMLALDPGTLDWGREGGADKISTKIVDKENNRLDKTHALIPEISAQLAMGGGAVIDLEVQQGSWAIMRQYLTSTVRVTSPSNAVIIEVRGDSMEPTLRSGDRVMIDTGDTTFVPGQVYAIRDDLTETAMVKRLGRSTAGDPADHRIRVISDNSAEASYDLPLTAVVIIGRVVWMGRAM